MIRGIFRGALRDVFQTAAIAAVGTTAARATWGDSEHTWNDSATWSHAA